MRRPPLFTSRSLLNLALLVPVLLIASSRPRWRPETPPPLAGEALVAEAAWTGNAERRLEILRRAVVLAPRSSRAQNELALQLQRMGRPEKALPRIDAALELEPEAATLHFNRGNILMDLGRFEESVAAYSHAIELEPAPLFFVNRGSALMALTSREQALQDFRRAADLAPDFPGVHDLIRRLSGGQKEDPK